MTRYPNDLMVTHQKREGQLFCKMDPIRINVGLTLAAIVAFSNAKSYIECARLSTDSEVFAQKIASIVEPRWLDTMTLLKGAESVGTRVTVYYFIKGWDRFITDNAVARHAGRDARPKAQALCLIGWVCSVSSYILMKTNRFPDHLLRDVPRSFACSALSGFAPVI